MKIDEIITEKCWQGYKQVGMKKKGDRMVPNCVPINDDMDFEDMDTPKCEEGHYYCRESKMCKPIPQGYTLRQDGYLIKDNEQLDVITLEDDQDFHEYYGYPGYVEEDGVWEAEYRGRKVKLGKPMAGDVKKFKVYVKNPKGNVVKVNFGQKGMKIKKSNPARRRSFRARHNCDNPGPRHKARYWSCRKW